jgi:hypothetical protein
MLQVGASGARVRAGADAIGVVGAFLPAVCTPAGEVVAPAGPPSIVLVAARAPGVGSVDIMTGDPWTAPRSTTMRVIVEQEGT